MRSAIFRNFSAIAFCLSTSRAGALCAEVLLLEASGVLVTAPQFFRDFSAVFRNFLQFFAIGFDAP